MVIKSIIFLLVAHYLLILFRVCTSNTGVEGDGVDVFFTESVLRVSEGENVSVCIMALGFDNDTQSVTLLRNVTYISAFLDSFLNPPFRTIIELSSNVPVNCSEYHIRRDQTQNSVDRLVLFSVINMDIIPVTITVPNLMLIIEADPPSIVVPEIISVSEGNVAVVCFTATFPASGEAVIGLSTQDISTSSDDYDNASIPRTITFASSKQLRQCIRIPTFKNTDSSGFNSEAFSISVFPINSTSTTALPVLSATTVTVRLFERCVQGDLKLVNGSDPSQGRVEVCVGGFFATVCDSTKWTEQEALTVCAQLGFSGAVSVPRSTTIFGTGPGPFLPGIFSCPRSSDNFLSDCSVQEQISGNPCQPNTGVYCGCVDNSVRLVEFQESQGQVTEGRVEICKSNQWGSVCSLGWDNADAQVICRQLNIQSDYTPSILKLSDGFFPAGSGPIFLSDVQCTGEELNISSCPSSSMNLQQCSHEQDAGVRCDGRPIFRGCEEDQFQCDDEQLCIDQSNVCDGIPDCASERSSFFFDNTVFLTPLDELNCKVCSDNEVRALYGGSSPQEGVVEICSNGTFHRIPVNEITVAEAAVLCRHLKLGTTGFPFPARDLLQIEGASLLTQSGFFDTATLNCTGSENSINDCTIQTQRSQFLNFAAIKCLEASSCEDGSMRLVPETPPTDGSEPQEGRLEICYQGIWGAVYDTDWSGLDAAVTCQSFGFNPLAALPLSSVYYASDPPILPVVYDVPQCTSLINSTILDCSQSFQQFRGLIRRRSISEPQDVFPQNLASPTSIRLRRQIIFPPNPNFSQEGGLGHLILGVTGAAALPDLVGVQCGDAVPVGGTQVYNCYKSSGCDDFVETTNSVENCCDSLDLEAPVGSFYQLSGDNRCMACPTTSPSQTDEIRLVPCFNEGAIRLVFRGQSGRAGVPQICRNGIWSFVCSIRSSDARVACRQLGFEEFPNAFPQVLFSTSPISGVVSPHYQINFGCDGSEQNFSMCSNFNQSSFRCELSSIVNLTCPALPRVLLDPLLFGQHYVVEQNRTADLYCTYNDYNFPLPNSITINGDFRSAPARILRFRATLNDSGIYNCTVQSLAGSTTRSVEILVQGADGIVTSIGYLRMSSVNSQRQRPEGSFALIGRVSASELTNLVFIAIPPALPGQQTVTCTNVTRSSVDTERRLDRFECVIITRGGSTDANAGAALAQVAATFIDIAYPGLYTNFQVSSIGFCGNDETVFNNVTLEWPETVAGDSASIPCPGASGKITRQCGSNMEWMAPNTSPCKLAINIINAVLSQKISLDNYEELSNRVAIALRLANNDPSQQNDTLLELVSRFFDIVTALVETNSASGQSVLIMQPVVRSLSASVAALQQWPANAFVANRLSSRILLSLESVIALYAQMLGINETAVITEENFVLVAENALVSVLSQTGRTVSFENTNLPSPVGSTRLADNQVASIALPPSLFGRIRDRTQVGVFFALYTKNTLFPVRGQANSTNIVTKGSTTVVGTPVVASTVGPGLSFTNLKNPVQINLRLMSMEDSVIRPGSQTCVSWDFDAAGGNGNWSTEGCTTSLTCDNVVRCNCTHLTNFAVLVDICSRVDPDGCRTTEVFDAALSAITIIGVVLSMIGLILTVITLLVFKRLRIRDATVYHVQLSIAVFLMLLVFVSGIEQVSRVGGCMLVSILLHYFTLAAIFWMTAEAVLMFHKLVLVFRKVTKRIKIITSLVCWLSPLIFLTPSLIADLANGRDADNDLIINRKEFCFLSNRFVFGFTFLLPMLLLLVFNCFVIGAVIFILVRHTKGNLARKKEAMGTKTAVRLIISISGIIFLFGISWLFAALTVTVPAIRLTAQVLFAILNSLQGFFIFIFFCILNEEARESWKELLCCGRYKSSYLNPSLKWGKNSKGERADRSKNSGSAFKGTSSIALSNGKTDESSHYYSESDGTRREKVDLSKAKEPTNYSTADPEYSTVTEPKKQDLSKDADNNPNVYTALILPEQQGEAEVHIYTKPAAVTAGNSSYGTSDTEITAVELQAKNNGSFPGPDTSVAVVETKN